jgi:replication fork protection complex subunit Tof1/Swi1
LFKNARLRLLLSLCGLERQGESDDPDATWIIPSILLSVELKDFADCIEKNRREPREQWGEDDSLSAEDMLRRKAAPAKPSRNIFGDDDDSEIDALELEASLLPTNKLTTKTSALAKLKKRRKKQASDDEGSEPDEEAIRERRKARLLADIAKRQKIKSSEFVHISDDEDDEDRDQEFFEKENKRRKGQASKIMELLRSEQARLSEPKSKKRKSDKTEPKKSKKPRTTSSDQDSEGSDKVDISDEDRILHTGNESSSPARDRPSLLVTSEDEDDTLLSSQSEINVGDEDDDRITDPKTILRKSKGPFAYSDSEEDAVEDVTLPEVEMRDKLIPTVDRMDIGDDEGSDLDVPSRAREQQRKRTVVLDDSDEE